MDCPNKLRKINFVKHAGREGEVGKEKELILFKFKLQFVKMFEVCTIVQV